MLEVDTPQIGLPFLLYDYEHFGVAGEVHQLIEAGLLPSDTFFRLAGVPPAKVDHRNTNRYLLNYMLMTDMVRHVSRPEAMRQETRDVLWGELPDAVIDIYSQINHPAYPMLDTMYYRLTDLVETVRLRRQEQGLTIPEAPFDRRLNNRCQDESSRCRGIARPLWRTIVKRVHPEWLASPGDYYPSSYIGPFAVVYEIGENAQRRRLVGHAVLSDPLVMRIYQESVETGIKGIGSGGQEDLRRLLAEEHPELHEGHEAPASI